MNGAVSHPSHTLQLVSGKFYVCENCGFKASERLHNLKYACVPRRRTAYGSAVLKAVQDGTPSSIAEAAKGDMSKVVSNAGSCGDPTPFPASILQTANQVPLGDHFAAKISEPPPLVTVTEAPIVDPLQNLRDLLDLEEAGEGVVWPPNMDANYARSILSEIAMCRLCFHT